MALMVSFANLREVLVDPVVEVTCRYESKVKDELTGKYRADNYEQKREIQLRLKSKTIPTNKAAKLKPSPAVPARKVIVDLKKSFRWYDTSLMIKGKPEFEKRFAGRVETGEESVSDPAM
jgi:phospholipase C